MVLRLRVWVVVNLGAFVAAAMCGAIIAGTVIREVAPVTTLTILVRKRMATRIRTLGTCIL
jgi:hypothetical protein